MLPKFTHLFTALPSPPIQFIDKLKKVIFAFIWGGKVDRIKRSSLYKKYFEGGLAMTEKESYIEALKVTWVRRQIVSDHVWTALFDEEISAGNFLWKRNARSLTNFVRTVRNIFWKETILAYAKFTEAIPIHIEDGGRCSLWYSNDTKFKDKEIVCWKNKGIHNVNDILTDNVFLTLQEFKERYNVNVTYLDLQGIIRSLSKHFDMRRSRIERHSEPIIHPFLSSVLEKKKGAKQFYDRLIRKKYRRSHNTWERR